MAIPRSHVDYGLFQVLDLSISLKPQTVLHREMGWILDQYNVAMSSDAWDYFDRFGVLL